jgi:hypothetical protein
MGFEGKKNFLKNLYLLDELDNNCTIFEKILNTL